jgi:hypothetical protein
VPAAGQTKKIVGVHYIGPWTKWYKERVGFGTILVFLFPFKSYIESLTKKG